MTSHQTSTSEPWWKDPIWFLRFVNAALFFTVTAALLEKYGPDGFLAPLITCVMFWMIGQCLGEALMWRLRRDRRRMNAIIDRIDAMKADPGSVTQADIDAVNAEVEEIHKRYFKKKYQRPM